MKIAILATAAPLAAAPTPARTQEGAQANGLPLSEILARIEAQADFAAVQSVEWHDRQWEIDCRKTDGAQVEVKIDPATGEPSTRCSKARTTVCLDDSGPKCPAPWTTGHAGQGVQVGRAKDARILDRRRRQTSSRSEPTSSGGRT